MKKPVMNKKKSGMFLKKMKYFIKNTKTKKYDLFHLLQSKRKEYRK
jgi:hypothetical protein